MKIKSFKRDYTPREKLGIISIIGIFGAILLAGITTLICLYFTTTNSMVVAMAVIFLLVMIVVICGIFIISIINLYKVMYSFYDPTVLDTVVL